MIKFIANINHHGKSIRTIDKDNRTEACHMCGNKEDLEHGELCKKNKNNRE